MVHRAPINRDARTLRGGKNFHDFVERRFNREGVHVRTGDHDFPDLQLTQLDGTENKLLFPDGEQSPFAGLLNLNLQLLRGMGNAVAAWLHNAKRADNGAGDAIKEVDGPSEGVKEPCKRARNHQGDSVSVTRTRTPMSRTRNIRAERTHKPHCNSSFGWKQEGVDQGCRMERIKYSICAQGRRLRTRAGCVGWRRPLN